MDRFNTANIYGSKHVGPQRLSGIVSHGGDRGQPCGCDADQDEKEGSGNEYHGVEWRNVVDESAEPTRGRQAQRESSCSAYGGRLW